MCTEAFKAVAYLPSNNSEIATQLVERAPPHRCDIGYCLAVACAIHGPTPEPETNVAIEEFRGEHDRLDDQVTRLEER